jgi:hypothetical protein
MPTNRDRFRKWLERNEDYVDDNAADRIADAAARMFSGKAEIKGRRGSWYVARAILGGHEYLHSNGRWEFCLAAYYPKRAVAEALLTQSNQPPTGDET